MPEPRRALPPAAAPLTLEPTARDRAAYQRRRRAGVPGDGKSGRQRGTVPTSFRNGLPVRFGPDGKPLGYVYHGTGEDIYAGTYGDEHLDQPRDW